MQTKTVPDTSGLVSKTNCNIKISEIGSKKLITGLVITVALSAVENNVSK